MKWFLHCGTVIAAFVLLVGCSSGDNKPGATEKVLDTVQVEVMTVQPDTFIETSTYYGKVKPISDAQIVIYSGGKVERLSANEGDYVKAGTSLAAVDSGKAETMLETARLQERIALKNYEQTKKHLKEGNASQLAVDQAHLAYLNAHTAAIDAEKNYQGAMAITPLSGFVTYRYINPYQELPPGTRAFTIARTSAMKVEVALIESDAARIKKGTGATITTSDKVGFIGEVTSIALKAEESDKTYRAKITVPNPDNILRAGATVEVAIEKRKYTDALCIPTAVIRSDGVQHSVMVCTVENKAVRRVITPGPQSDNITMVTEGLLVGDRLIVSGQQLVTEGTPVRVMER
ncbi:MAG: efflux RND transporter periplasmic adaptor subunit [Chitinispirillaceae bacterium]|nr:efflux RND transporter periplasmic adaptor subunit [Chitinispirillaceae bacterium]